MYTFNRREAKTFILAKTQSLSLAAGIHSGFWAVSDNGSVKTDTGAKQVFSTFQRVSHT